MNTISKRMKEGMELRKIKQSELAEKTGISKGALSSYLSGRYLPKQNNMYLIANALNVSEAWLMGADVPMERSDTTLALNSKKSLETKIASLSNIHPIELKRFPILGEIACGKQKCTNENKESYIMAGTEIKADFCLIAKGDSMINARILDGDIVFIKKQDTVDNGEIAAVVTNNYSEATLKRVFYYREKALLILKAENPNYTDLIYQDEELNEVHILGKAISLQSDLK